MPAHATITPLSVHSRGGGHTRRRPAASAIADSRPRMYWLLATPPATTRWRTCDTGGQGGGRVLAVQVRGRAAVGRTPNSVQADTADNRLPTVANQAATKACQLHPQAPAHLRMRLLHPAHRPPAAFLQVGHRHPLEAGRNVGSQLAVGVCRERCKEGDRQAGGCGGEGQERAVPAPKPGSDSSRRLSCQGAAALSNATRGQCLPATGNSLPVAGSPAGNAWATHRLAPAPALQWLAALLSSGLHS